MERDEHKKLIRAIALREGTARQLAERFGITTQGLRRFAEKYMHEIENWEDPEEDPSGVTPQQLEDLWIANKYERLKRMQEVAEVTAELIQFGRQLAPAELATAIREYRSYMMLAANELGQLLHRGSGDSGQGDTLSVSIEGVDMDTMR